MEIPNIKWDRIDLVLLLTGLIPLGAAFSYMIDYRNRWRSILV